MSYCVKEKISTKKLQGKMGDVITQLNEGLLNRLHLNDDTTSAWYFNGHIYDTDLNVDGYKIMIFDIKFNFFLKHHRWDKEKEKALWCVLFLVKS
jgi:hypothetical protein